jgi:cell wall-associated NlpC family hydrolase
MIKTILSTVTILFLFGAFNPVSAQGKQVSINSSKGDVKFLDDITVEVAPFPTNAEPNTSVAKASKSEVQSASKKELVAASTATIESADKLQFKYALLLDTEIEAVQNLGALKLIDEWFGTRYRLGGSSKTGIDCSALMQVFFTALYGVTLPRTAKEQYNTCRKISRTELKEGDLVFFNTTGGISHVGMYLQNNKFVHASTSGGVTISDLFEDYWTKRFIGVGRIEDTQEASEVLFSKL